VENHALGGVQIVSANREPNDHARRFFPSVRREAGGRQPVGAAGPDDSMVEDRREIRENFKRSLKGQKAVSIRVALGALITQERLGTDDRETLRQILENPYLQYFLGLPEYQYRRPFHHSLMTHFRKRLGGDIIHEVNEWIALEESRKSGESQDLSDDVITPGAFQLLRPVLRQRSRRNRWN
jgi:hypothetical protein